MCIKNLLLVRSIIVIGGNSDSFLKSKLKYKIKCRKNLLWVTSIMVRRGGGNSCSFLISKMEYKICVAKFYYGLASVMVMGGHSCSILTSKLKYIYDEL